MEKLRFSCKCIKSDYFFTGNEFFSGKIRDFWKSNLETRYVVLMC